MEERKNTIVWIFEAGSPIITAFEMHEWLHESLRLQEEQICLIQIDGSQKRVYVKFVD
jgi:hypothetical protein